MTNFLFSVPRPEFKKMMDTLSHTQNVRVYPFRISTADGFNLAASYEWGDLRVDELEADRIAKKYGAKRKLPRLATEIQLLSGIFSYELPMYDVVQVLIGVQNTTVSPTIERLWDHFHSFVQIQATAGRYQILGTAHLRSAIDEGAGLRQHLLTYPHVDSVDLLPVIRGI